MTLADPTVAHYHATLIPKAVCWHETTMCFLSDMTVRKGLLTSGYDAQTYTMVNHSIKPISGHLRQSCCLI